MWNVLRHSVSSVWWCTICSFQIQTFKDIILQKDNQLMEINQMHEQELFKLAAKSDASADLEQVVTEFISRWNSEETLAVINLVSLNLCDCTNV